MEALIHDWQTARAEYIRRADYETINRFFRTEDLLCKSIRAKQSADDDQPAGWWHDGHLLVALPHRQTTLDRDGEESRLLVVAGLRTI